MNTTKSTLPTRWISRLAVAGSLLGYSTLLQGATLYWDPNGLSGPGGNGTWDNGTTAAWANNFNGVASPVVWNNANNDIANFRGTAGTVTISGGVTTNRLIFESSGYTLQGDTITLKQASAGNYDAMATTGTLTGTNTIKSNLVISPLAATGEVIARFANGTNANVVYDGTIGVDLGTATSGSGNKRLAFAQTGTGSITINGQIAAIAGTVGTAFQELHFGAYNGATNSGTYYVNSDNSATVSGTSLIAKGTVYVSNAGALGSNTISLGNGNNSLSGDDAKYLTVGGLTITRNITSNNISNATPLGYVDTLVQEFGGSTAHESTFSGTIYINQANLTTSAVSGGLVNISGLVQHGTTTSPGNFIKDGAGIVKLSRAAGNTYGVSGTKSTIVKAGTLIIANTSGSATGTSLVTVNTGATFGGAGYSTGLVTAQGAGSIFTPGDMGISGVSSIGTLNLMGGLSAASGATFKIDLNGASNDKINFGTAALTLGGIVTFDFISLGAVDATPYSLFLGSGAWSGAPTFVFNGPTGYELDSTYGSGNGYIWNAGSNSLTVQFAAIPEPSVTGLILLGGLACCLIRRRRATV
jgi:fibronectin-binding autotransporter adhesin